jgi:hypothetical protein
MDFPPIAPSADGFLYTSEMFDGESDWEDAQQMIYAKLRQSQVDPGSGHWRSEKIERDGVKWCHILTWTNNPKGIGGDQDKE